MSLSVWIYKASFPALIKANAICRHRNWQGCLYNSVSIEQWPQAGQPENWVWFLVGVEILLFRPVLGPVEWPVQWVALVCSWPHLYPVAKANKYWRLYLHWSLLQCSHVCTFTFTFILFNSLLTFLRKSTYSFLVKLRVICTLCWIWDYHSTTMRSSIFGGCNAM
jgi:hypothetical protein